MSPSTGSGPYTSAYSAKSTPGTRGVTMAGKGALISRNSTPVRESGAFGSPGSRAPPRPAGRMPVISARSCSSGVRRGQRTVSPSACSAEVIFGQAGFAQYKRRTLNSMRTGRPPVAMPARGRTQRLCTRSPELPQPVHRAGPSSRVPALALFTRTGSGAHSVEG
ncbi:hypothetical protein OG324_00960 [Streptomyces sp. NBC_01236]|nr:hypothetical protein OG324_00960 [Streptomyces sp. NBC_01236]